MTRLLPTLRILVPLLALGGSLACDPAATPEGEVAIRDMERVEKAVCACAPADQMCKLQGLMELEQLMERHEYTMGTDAQGRRLEAVGDRIVQCMERSG
ncbi:MAG: hypothetical protein R3F61_21230 [Myxococcota bacterium]